jgi:hypothetical protein
VAVLLKELTKNYKGYESLCRHGAGQYSNRALAANKYREVCTVLRNGCGGEKVQSSLCRPRSHIGAWNIAPCIRLSDRRRKCSD